ncbi:putative zinc-binding protein A33-like [Triplophysa rosa]|uniref:Zinc-binding protein A33-like n=1 Tax=Triplophysa rosa TaxID=992332 RepID=A0A9W7WRU3_TRIRA|nr:putative zinc-binding protein A33-like [Triplophysa rosa]
MAFQNLISEQDLTCPVCCDIFRDPVVMLCSHSICRTCLQQFWSIKGFQECPVCRKRFTGSEPLSNLALRNLCDSLLQERNQETTSSGAEMICTVHKESLKLFCLDDRRPVCLVCRDSETHLNHKFRPVEEAAPLLKDELKTALKCLQEQLKKQFCFLIQIQAQQTVRCICEDFEKLHRFLREEEMLRVSALREEEDQKKIQSLSQKIQNIQDDLATADMDFLECYSFSVERTQNTQPSAEVLSGALINVAEHLGNLKFKVWEKMQKIVQFSPVTLDTNTANPLLILSDDLTSVKYSTDGQHHLDNPERFDNYYCVLGSEGFDSGIHSWDVEVGDNACWSVGVTTASNQRKGEDFFNAGVWRVRYMEGQYTSQSPLQARRPLAVKQRLHMIRTQLDFNRGCVLFSDAATNTVLLTFTTTFNERIFPFLCSSCTSFPLKILPVKFSITPGSVNLALVTYKASR